MRPDSGVVVMFDWIRKTLAKTQPAADPYEQFVREFIAECRRQNILPKSYDPQARAFVFARDDGSDLTLQMHNMFAEWLSRDQARRAELIARFVQSVVETRTDSQLSPEELPGELMPGIRSHAQISNLMLHNWLNGAPADDSFATAYLPFAGDLVVCTMRDHSRSMSQMTNANLAAASLSIEQAMQHAMVNFRNRLPPPAFQSLGDGLFGCNNLEDHQSALLLFAPGQDYPLPPIDGTPVVAVPGRNVFYLTGAANRPGIARLLDLAGKASEQPHFCSSSLLQWNGQHWVEGRIPMGDDLDKRQREIAQHQLAADYNAQKQLLDQYYQKQGRDIFVASVMLFRARNSSEIFSLATLASGTTGTLLPHADRLAFGKQIIDPATGLAQQKPGDYVQVAWSSAMDIVGHLFEPVPYLYPPRLRALGFPQADEWAKLKAVELM
jgi:hypothetical protein